MELFKEYNISLKGKNAVIINRSILVGKPLIGLLLSQNATVTVCHSHTKDLFTHTQQADIVISAVGKKNFLTADMIKENAVIIDVSIVFADNWFFNIDFEWILTVITDKNRWNSNKQMMELIKLLVN